VWDRVRSRQTRVEAGTLSHMTARPTSSCCTAYPQPARHASRDRVAQDRRSGLDGGVWDRVRNRHINVQVRTLTHMISEQHTSTCGEFPSSCVVHLHSTDAWFRATVFSPALCASPCRSRSSARYRCGTGSPDNIASVPAPPQPA
jgi:hypothetical protein